MRAAERRGENLLRDGASRGAVAAAGHLSDGHGGSERLLGAAVGGVEREVEEKREDARKLDTEMRRESLHVGDVTGPAQEGAEPLDEAPARDRHAVAEDGPGPVSIPQGEGPAQDRLHRGGQRGARMIADQQATAPQ